MKRLYRNLLLLILITFLFNLFLLSEYKLKAIKVQYVVTNFLEYYVKPVDTNAPDIALTGNIISKCRIPRLKFNEKQAMDYLTIDEKRLEALFKACPLTAANATLLSSLVRVTTSNKEVYTVELDMDKIMASFQLNKQPDCSLQGFDKKMNVSEIKNELDFTSKLVHFTASSNFTINLTQSGYFYLKCHGLNSLGIKSLIFDNVLTVLPYNMSKLMERRLNYRRLEEESFRSNDPLVVDQEFKRCNKKSAADEKMNVLILGLDSVSSSQFRRVFPRTFKHLNATGTVFESLNSVGSNTYPNLLAMLAGLVEEALPEYNISTGEIDYFRSRDQFFHDNLPFIWKAYEDLGYVTMYQEDDPLIAIFNYYKDGFRHWPAGLYNRAFNLKYYDIRSGPDKCHYQQPTIDVWMKQIELFVEQMNTEPNKRTPYFSFNFLTEYTHNYMAVASSFDQRMERMLVDLKQTGALNNTLIIIMGDHGNRITRYSYATETGKLERFRPFLSITLPDKLKHSQLANNLDQNKDKLVSFFDLYQTLRHFLFINKCSGGGSDPQFTLNTKASRSNRGISLFEQIPADHTCESALIPSRFCNCFDSKSLTSGEFLAETQIEDTVLGQLICGQVNAITADNRHQCELFKFSRIDSIKRVKLDKVTVYVGMAVLEPGDAWFEAMFSFVGSGAEVKSVGSVKRMSRYGDQSKCVDSAGLKDYCFCKGFNSTGLLTIGG